MLPLAAASQAPGRPEWPGPSETIWASGNVAGHAARDEKGGPEKASRTLPCPVPNFPPSGEDAPETLLVLRKCG